MSNGLSSSIAASVSSSGNSSTRITTRPKCRLRRRGIVASARSASSSISASDGGRRSGMVSLPLTYGGWHGREAGRSGAAYGAARAPWLGRGRGPRRDPQELPFRELLGSLGLHVANGAHCRENGPPPRALQRLQPGRGHIVDA